MPELPDVTVYVERLQAMLRGRVLETVRIRSAFLLRTALPPVEETNGRAVLEVSRLGKRIVFRLSGEIYLVVHLMIAGRLRWRQGAVAATASGLLAAFDFEHGSLLLTEAGAKRRASLHVVEGAQALAAFDRGGLEVMDATPAAVRDALCRENHTLKRALTDPRILSGIGNAYSDEILHCARLSPFKQTRSLSDEEHARLFTALRDTLATWTGRLREQVADGFPEKVTAFREGMAVHGRYREPCPACGAPVQRIRYASNECNYCARCQTGGRLLADRVLSRLLKANWPRTVDELERP